MMMPVLSGWCPEHPVEAGRGIAALPWRWLTRAQEMLRGLP